MHKPEVELVVIIIGMLIIGAFLLRNRKARTDGSRYYKITPGPRE